MKHIKDVIHPIMSRLKTKIKIDEQARKPNSLNEIAFGRKQQETEKLKKDN